MIIKVILSLFIFCGCSTFSSKSMLVLNYSDSIRLKLDKKDVLFPKIKQYQKLFIEYNGKQMQSQSVLVYDGKTLGLVALGPIGSNLFQIKYEEGVLTHSKSAFLPKEFDPSFLLIDLLFIYSSKSDLINWIEHEKLNIVDSKVRREINSGSNLHINIEYIPNIENARKIIYHNLERRYKLSIEILTENLVI